MASLTTLTTYVSLKFSYCFRAILILIAPKAGKILHYRLLNIVIQYGRWSLILIKLIKILTDLPQSTTLIL